MTEERIAPVPCQAPTRRQLLTGIALGMGTLAFGLEAWGTPQRSTMKEVPATEANKKLTALHIESNISATPQRIYEIILSSKQFAAFTGMAAKIDSKAGGAFSMFGGMIAGRNVELVPYKRIVQAWRPGSWPAGIYSIVEFEFKEHASGCTFVIDHKGFPEGDFDSLTSGWHSHYIDGIRKFVG